METVIFALIGIIVILSIGVIRLYRLNGRILLYSNKLAKRNEMIDALSQIRLVQCKRLESELEKRKAIMEEKMYMGDDIKAFATQGVIDFFGCEDKKRNKKMAKKWKRAISEVKEFKLNTKP